MIGDEEPIHLKLGRIPMRFYKLNEILCTLAGQWPFQRKEINFLIVLIITIFAFLACCMQTLYLIEIKFAIKKVIQFLPVAIALYGIFVTNILFFWKRKENKNLWEIILDDWASERTMEETMIKESLAKLGDLITKAITFILGVGTVIFAIVTSFLSQIYDIIAPINGTHPPMLPFPVIAMFDHEEYFLTCLLFQEICVILVMICAIAGQTSICMFSMHLFGMIYVLRYRLENAIPKSKLHNLSWIPCEEVDKDFRESLLICIQRHREVLKFTDIAQAYYGPVFIVIIMAVLFVVSPSLAQFMTIELMDYKVVLQVILTIALLFVNCYLGQIMIDLSSGILDKAYNSSWYHCSPHLQKLLLFVMRRCDKTCHIGYYDMYIVSFTFFRTMLQTGISYCMVLREFQ